MLKKWAPHTPVLIVHLFDQPNLRKPSYFSFCWQTFDLKEFLANLLPFIAFFCWYVWPIEKQQQKKWFDSNSLIYTLPMIKQFSRTKEKMGTKFDSYTIIILYVKHDLEVENQFSSYDFQCLCFPRSPNEKI